MTRRTTKTGNEPEDLAQEAFAGIRRMLFLNEIAPGHKLRYRELAERLGMSPTPVVQALKWLAYQGLVRHEPNRGFFVEPMSVEEVEEIYELREILEVALLPKALANLGEGGVARLQKALEDHLAVSGGRYLKQRLIADMEFHMAIASLSGGKTTQRILRELFDLLYSQYKAEILFARPMEDVGTEHKEIFERIVARDLEGAQRALAAHLRGVREHVLEGLRQAEEERLALAV